MDEQLKKAHRKGLEMERKMNESLKKIKRVDTSKVVLTELTYQKTETPVSK